LHTAINRKHRKNEFSLVLFASETAATETKSSRALVRQRPATSAGNIGFYRSRSVAISNITNINATDHGSRFVTGAGTYRRYRLAQKCGTF